MRVIRITSTDAERMAKASGTLMGLMDAGHSIIPVRFLVPDGIPLPDDCEEVKTPQAEAPKEKPAKGRRGYPSVKVEITGTLAEKLRAYSGTDAFMISVIDSWKKWGKLSPGQIFWIEKKLGA